MTAQQNAALQETAAAHRVSSALDWDIPELKLRSFDTVMQTVQKLEDLRIDEKKVEHVSAKGRGVDPSDDPGYICMALDKLLFTSAGTVQAPGFGLMQMTAHAQGQIGKLIGVRWSKFFGNQDPDKINRAVRDHLKSLPDEEKPIVKLIAREHYGKGNRASDALLRGVVSPGYSEIKDSVILERIRATQGPSKMKDMGFTTFDLRDNGSHYCLVFGEPVDLTKMGLPPSDFAGRTGPHGAPPKDVGYYGFRMRNSEVGTYSYTADGYIMRMVCINGLMVPVEGERILKRVHRGITEKKLDELIEGMFRKIPHLREEIAAKNRRLKSVVLHDPEEEIRNFLGRQGQPIVVQDAVVQAYSQEPQATAYGVLQAITSAARALRNAPDRQHELELIGGTYVETAIKRAA